MSTDAELVAGVLAGDREAFAAMYDRYADRLYDFCVSVLRDRHEAEDAVQDTFVLVAQRLAQLNDPERLRPWLYAVARSVAFRRVKVRKRVVLDTEVSDMVDPNIGPQRAAEVAALRDLVWDAAAGLSERDRALLDLHLRQGLDGAELGEAMGVSAGHAYVLLNRLREQVERSLGAFLIARLGRKECTELDGMLSGWDGKFSPLMRKRVARHVDSCDVCSDRRRSMVSPLALLAAVPLMTAPLYLRDRVVNDVELVAHQASMRAAKPSRLPMAAAAVTLLVALGLAAIWTRDGDVPGTPVALDLVPSSTLDNPSSGESPTDPTQVAPGSATGTVAPPGRTTTTTTRPGATTTTTPPTTTTTTTTPPQPPRDTVPPQIVRPLASPTTIVEAPCANRLSTVTATVTDNVGVGSVKANWTHSNKKTGTVTMTLQPNGRWQGTLGPFPRGNVTWSVVATDTSGNTTTGPTGTIFVDVCIT
jgi:RNA polymerase sigma factor (sigma-70 family)